VEALAAYTRGAAYAGFWDTETGSLAPGALADAVVLSGDPFSMPAEEGAEFDAWAATNPPSGG